MCVDVEQNDTEYPIIFPEWAFISQHMIKRKDFRFDVLLKENLDDQNSFMQYSLFSNDATDYDNWIIDPVTNETVPKPVKEFEPIYYRRIWEHE